MGGSESRCCADTPEKKSVADRDGEELRKNAESPFKSSRILHDDPRSPSQCIDRTPIEVAATPVQPKPLMRVQPMIDSSSLRNRHVGNQSETSKPGIFSFDPRSPGPPGTRTPITAKSIGLTSHEQQNEAIPAISHMLDPRSPSQEIVRTPLLVEECPKEAGDAMVICETPKKHQENVQGGMSNPSFSPDAGLADPRSPTQGIDRTPVTNLEKPYHKSDAISARNLHDPRSPTTEVSRTPIGGLFSGHRELRRTVLMTNALMASPMSKKITRSSSMDASAADKEFLDEASGNKEYSPVEDEIPAILRCNFDFNNSCSSSMIASIGSEVDCISLDQSLDEDQVLLHAVDTVKEDWMESHLRSGDVDACGEIVEEENFSCETNDKEDVASPQQTVEMPALPDLLPSVEKLQDRETATQSESKAGVNDDENKIDTEDESAKNVHVLCSLGKTKSEEPSENINESSIRFNKETKHEGDTVKAEDSPGSASSSLKLSQCGIDINICPSGQFSCNVGEITPQNELDVVQGDPGSLNQEIENVNQVILPGSREESPGKIEKSLIPQIFTCSTSDAITERKCADPYSVAEEDQIELAKASDSCLEKENEVSSVEQEIDGQGTQEGTLASVEDIGDNLKSDPSLKETFTEINPSKTVQGKSEKTKQVEIQQPANTLKVLSGDKREGSEKGQNDTADKGKKVRKLRTPTSVSHRKKKTHPARSAPPMESSPISLINRSTSEKKTSLLRRPKAKSASDDTRAGVDQENSKSMIKKPTRISESKLVTPTSVRSPLAVLTNDSKTKGDMNSVFSSSPAKSTRLPKYQGTPPIAVNRSLSVSFSGSSSSRSHSVERLKAGQRSFTCGKEN